MQTMQHSRGEIMIVKFLSVGMEYSGFAGSCSGAGLDALRMFNLVKDKCTWYNFLKNESATKDNVVENLKKICDSDLAIFFYAGHGSSGKIKKHAPEEKDGNDEMICLYDTVLIDDEIWNIVSKAKGRVFLIFDCCHSETMFMAKPFSKWKKFLSFFGLKRKEKRLVPKPIEFSSRTSEEIDLLCWSGCADDKTSMGNSNGGVFTNTILKYVDFKLSYDEIWKKISEDKILASKEIVKRTILKKDSNFANKPIFF